MLTIALNPHDEPTYIDDIVSKDEYFCPVCGAPLIPKRGEILRHHFAHKADHPCKDEWERKERYDSSEWHYSWEERFPKQNREVTLDLGGTRHRADILTGKTVVEFQHSALCAKDFNDRNTYYHDLGYKVVWLFDECEAFESGKIAESPDGEWDCVWDNPRNPFDAYDLAVGNIDLFFQLRDDSAQDYIVRVAEASDTGFEQFTSCGRFGAEEFLAYVGLVNGVCPPPDLKPSELNEDYLRFRERYGIKLNKQQERAVQTVDGANLLIAVPGSGKTTVLVDRLGYMVIERGIAPESIMSITYTTAGTNEMRTRFARVFSDAELARRMQFRTINSLAWEIIGRYCASRGNPRPMLLDETSEKKLLREIYQSVLHDYPTEGDLLNLASAISFIKNMKLSKEEIEAADKEMEGLSEIYEAYKGRLIKDKRVDFDDQCINAMRVLRQYSGILDLYRRQYRYWCVDEAQDTSRLQHDLIRELAGADGNIFMVGDEDQSIYGFRAAYPKALLNFKHDYRNTYVQQMGTNYRSYEEITDAAAGFIRRCRGRYDKPMKSHRGPGGSVERIDLTARADQYDWLAGELRGTNVDDCAVLFRDNDCAIPLVDLLLREGVPFRLSKFKKTFFSDRTVQDILAFLKLSRNQNDEQSFMRIYYKCGIYFTKNDAEWACKNARRKHQTIPEALIAQAVYGKRKSNRKGRAEDFSDMICSLPKLSPATAIDAVMGFGYEDYLERESISAGRIELLRVLASREKNFDGLMARLEFLESKVDSLAREKASAGVTPSTIHSAKGREWRVVYIMDAIDGVLPTSRMGLFNASKDSPDVYQEERRLLYVAMTRAKDRLVLLAPKDKKTSFIDEVVAPSLPKKTTIGVETSAPYVQAQREIEREQKRAKERREDAKEEQWLAEERARSAKLRESFEKQLERRERIEEEKRRAEQEQMKREIEQGKVEVMGSIDQQETCAIDSFGRRWARCEVCGEIKLADDFSIVGGLGKINLGTCRDCMMKRG